MVRKSSNTNEAVDAHLQLSEIVAMHLREQIISGKIRQGSFLRIENIAKTLNVSPTPVREGLLLLKSEAFVRLMPRRGFVVNSFRKDDLADLFWAQATIGAKLAQRAAECMSDETIELLEQLQVEYEATIKRKDETSAAVLGHEFHRTINKSANSPRLAYNLSMLTRQLPNRFYASIEGQLDLAVNYHGLILEAIRQRDAEKVGSLMFEHTTAGGDHLIASLSNQGLWLDQDEGEEGDS